MELQKYLGTDLFVDILTEKIGEYEPDADDIDITVKTFKDAILKKSLEELAAICLDNTEFNVSLDDVIVVNSEVINTALDIAIENITNEW